MAMITNPLDSYLVPGGNPTGNNISIENPLDVATGTNPFMTPIPTTTTALPTTMGFSTAGTAANDSGGVVPGAPAMPTSATSAFPANSGPFSSTGGSVPQVGGTTTSSPLLSGAPSAPGGINYGDANMFGFNLLPPDQQAGLLHTLSKTYGPGVGDAIFNFLKSGAGFNQDVLNNYVNNLLASLQPGINRGTENIMEQFSTMGNRFGSGAQIGLGDYLSQVNLNEGQIISGAEMQMYEQSLQDYLNLLTGTSNQTAQARANSPGLGDLLSGILGLTKAGAGAATAGIGASADGAGTLSSILAGLAAL